jgi:hypothetical protein
MIWVGQRLTQSPQWLQADMKSPSAIAQGGRIVVLFPLKLPRRKSDLFIAVAIFGRIFLTLQSLQITKKSN